MSFEYSQDSYWNGATFYQQNLDTVPLETDGFFESSPHLEVRTPSLLARLLTATMTDFGGRSILPVLGTLAV